MRNWRIALCLLLLCVGAIAILYSANMTAYSVWLSAHPQFDDELWAARAIAWLVATLGIIVVEMAGFWLFIKRQHRWRSSSVGNHCPDCGYDLRESVSRCPECGHEANVNGSE